MDRVNQKTNFHVWPKYDNKGLLYCIVLYYIALYGIVRTHIHTSFVSARTSTHTRYTHTRARARTFTHTHIHTHILT